MNTRNRAVSTVVALLLLPAPWAAPVRGALVDAVWNAGSGNWSIAANWLPAVVPNNGTGGNTYHVKIDNGAGANAVVALNQSATIDLLTITAGDTLNFNNIQNLRVEVGPIVNDGLISLNGVNSGTELRLGSSLSLNGSGVLQLSNPAVNRLVGVTGGPQHLTHAATHTIRGGGTFGSDTLTLTNNGLIEVSTASTMSLDLAAGANINAGTIQAVGTGILNINGSSISNTNGLIKALGTSTVNINPSSSIVGGQLQTDAGAAFSGNSSALQDITLTGLIRHDNSEEINYGGTITNNGRIELNSTNASTVVRVAASGVTFTGTGAIEGNGDPDVLNFIAGTSPATPFLLVNSATHTIRGGVQIGENTLNLTNQGLIDAFQPSAPISLELADGANVNTGTIQASAAGTLNIVDSVIDNTAGFIKALGTSTVNLTGSTIIGGPLQADPTAAFSGNGSALQGITLTGLLRHDNAEEINYGGTITNNGRIELNSINASTVVRVAATGVTFTGTGVIEGGNDPDVLNFIAGTSAATPFQLVNSAAHTIRGGVQIGENTLNLNNAGLIDAFQPLALISIELADGANVNSGTIQASATGTLNIVDSVLDNTAGSIRALDTSAVNLTGSTIDGGQLQADAGASFSGDNSTLQDITLTGLMRHDNGDEIIYEGAIVNNGRIELNSINVSTVVRVNATGVTFTGTGEIVFGNDPDNLNFIAVNGAIPPPTFVNGVSHTLRGSGNLGANSVHITNLGTIIANQTTPMVFDAPDSGQGFLNNGTIQVSSTLNIPTGVFTNAGNVTVDATRSLTRTGPYLQTAGTTKVNGTLAASGGVQLQGGTLSGAGAVSGAGSLVTSTGTIAPGDGVGQLSLNNGLNLEPGSVVAVEIGGTTPVTQHDRLAVTGSTNLDGTLRVTFVNGFDPSIGQSFVVMTYPNTPLTTLGKFTHLDVPCNLVGRRIQVDITTTQVIVHIIDAAFLPGVDVNCDCGYSMVIDVQALIQSMLDPAAFDALYPGCTGADVNNDGQRNGKDVQAFVNALLN